MAALSEEALSHALRFNVIGSGLAQANRSFHHSGVDELVPDKFVKDQTLMYLSVDHRNSLNGRNTHPNCLQDTP